MSGGFQAYPGPGGVIEASATTVFVPPRHWLNVLHSIRRTGKIEPYEAGTVIEIIKHFEAMQFAHPTTSQQNKEPT